MNLVFIGVFGLIGVFSRYFLGMAVAKLPLPPFPFGTFLINILGAFIIGVIEVVGIERAALSPDFRLGIMVGLLGGFTTFSSYCIEAVRLVEKAEYLPAALYLIGSPVCGFAAAFGGILVTRKLLGAPL